MSKRNREKRTAKQRTRRQQRGPTPPRQDNAAHFRDSTGDFWPPQPPSPEVLANALLSAATQFQRDRSAATACATELAAEQSRTAGIATGIALRTVISGLWQGGWLPVDLWQIIRRRQDSRTVGLIVDAIAADTAQYSAATVHQRWIEQVRQLDATVWWRQDSPHLGQWASQQGISIRHALVVVITLLAELMSLPELPRILPLPGEVAAGDSAARTGVDQKVLARVRALLAKAESTQFPEEAEALSTKAQELMNRHAFERALLDATEHKPQQVTSSRLWLDNPYVEPKSQLVAAIAASNRCRSVLHPSLGFVSLVGDPLDLEITELMTTSLLVQATRAMTAEGSRISRGGVSRTKSFRKSFLIAYAIRIGERLREASETAHDTADDPRLLPVLTERTEVVDEAFRAMFEHTVEKRVSVNNGDGWYAGRAAADRADLAINRTAVGQ
jgi:hypothetical protein